LGEPKIQSCRHLAPKESFDPQMEYEALEISEVGGPLKEKYFYITVALDPFESNVFTHYKYNCYWGVL